MKLYRYRNLVRRHWWILTLTIGIGLLLEGYVLFTKPQLFESLGQLVIREELIRDNNTGGFQDTTPNFIGTAVEQLKSPIVLGRARARVAQRYSEEVAVIDGPAETVVLRFLSAQSGMDRVAYYGAPLLLVLSLVLHTRRQKAIRSFGARN